MSKYPVKYPKEVSDFIVETFNKKGDFYYTDTIYENVGENLFEQSIPEPTEVSKDFIWTDSLVKEFVITYNKIDKLITGVDPIMQTIKDFKQSHTSTAPTPSTAAESKYENNLKDANKWTKMPYGERPPLGVMPEWRWNKLRFNEVDEAIIRYTGAMKQIPQEWIDERYELAEWLKAYHQKKSTTNEQPAVEKEVINPMTKSYKDARDGAFKEHFEKYGVAAYPSTEQPTQTFTLIEIMECYSKVAPLFSPLFNNFLNRLQSLNQ